MEMDVPAPHGASDTYGQLSDTEADTIRALRCGFTRVAFSVKRMSIMVSLGHGHGTATRPHRRWPRSMAINSLLRPLRAAPLAHLQRQSDRLDRPARRQTRTRRCERRCEPATPVSTAALAEEAHKRLTTGCAFDPHGTWCARGTTLGRITLIVHTATSIAAHNNETL